MTGSLHGTDIMDIASNIVGLVAVICFAVPAIYANKYGHLVSRLVNSRAEYNDKSIVDLRDSIVASLEGLRGEWTSWKSRLLVIGTFLAGLSYVIGAIKYLF